MYGVGAYGPRPQRQRARRLLLPHDLQRADHPAGRTGGPRRVDGLLRGMYLLLPGPESGRPRAQLLASGVAGAVGAGGAADARRGMGRRRRRLVGDVVERASSRRRRVRAARAAAPGRGSAASRSSPPRWPTRRRARSWPCRTTCAPCPTRSRAGYPATTRRWGTDGFGFADTRGAARRFFHVDAQSVVVATLQRLAQGRRGQARTRPRRVREVPARLGRGRGCGKHRGRRRLTHPGSRLRARVPYPPSAASWLVGSPVDQPTRRGRRMSGRR